MLNHGSERERKRGVGLIHIIISKKGNKESDGITETEREVLDCFTN